MMYVMSSEKLEMKEFRGRPNFGFGFGFGAESCHMTTFGLVFVSAETEKLTFGLFSVSAESDLDFRSSTESQTVTLAVGR